MFLSIVGEPCYNRLLALTGLLGLFRENHYGRRYTGSFRPIQSLLPDSSAQRIRPLCRLSRTGRQGSQRQELVVDKQLQVDDVDNVVRDGIARTGIIDVG